MFWKIFQNHGLPHTFVKPYIILGVGVGGAFHLPATSQQKHTVEIQDQYGFYADRTSDGKQWGGGVGGAAESEGGKG